MKTGWGKTGRYKQPKRGDMRPMIIREEDGLGIEMGEGGEFLIGKVVYVHENYPETNVKEEMV